VVAASSQLILLNVRANDRKKQEFITDLDNLFNGVQRSIGLAGKVLVIIVVRDIDHLIRDSEDAPQVREDIDTMVKKRRKFYESRYPGHIAQYVSCDCRAGVEMSEPIRI